MSAKYWIAINGPSVALCAFALDSVECSPRPSRLFGFPTLREAQEAQSFLLTAPISECVKRQKVWRARPDILLVIHAKPEPPTRGATLWFSDGKPITQESDVQRN